MRLPGWREAYAEKDVYEHALCFLRQTSLGAVAGCGGNAARRMRMRSPDSNRGFARQQELIFLRGLHF